MAMKNRQLLALVLSGVLVISTLGGCSAFGQLAKQTVETGKEYYDQNKDSEQEDPVSYTHLGACEGGIGRSFGYRLRNPVSYPYDL